MAPTIVANARIHGVIAQMVAGKPFREGSGFPIASPGKPYGLLDYCGYPWVHGRSHSLFPKERFGRGGLFSRVLQRWKVPAFEGERRGDCHTGGAASEVSRHSISID